MRDFVKKLIIMLYRLLPLRDDIILESHPDFADNAYALYGFFLEQGVNQRHRIHWALHGSREGAEASGTAGIPETLPENVDVFYLDAHGFSQMWQRFRVLYRSRYILDGNSYIYKRRKGQVRIHLGHGMPVKIAPGYSNAGKIGDVDGCLVTSPFWCGVYADRIGVPKDVLLPLGYPRNDVLVSRRDGITHLGTYIMWMPTYRQHRNHPEEALASRFPYGMPEVMTPGQLGSLDELLGSRGIRLYFRPHPAQELSVMKREKLQNIVVADDAFLKGEGISLYEMLASAKALVTDYSSVYYDFLLTGRPIGITMRDRDEYFRKYACAFADVTEGVRGFRIESFEELLLFFGTVDVQEGKDNYGKMNLLGKVSGLQNIDGVKKMSAFRKMGTLSDTLGGMREKYHQHTDGQSAERLYRYLQETYHFDTGYV